MSKSFVPMNPELLQKITDETEDVLTPLANRAWKAISSATCPTCGAVAVPRVDPDRPFTADSPIQNFRPYCPECNVFIYAPIIISSD